MSHTSGRRSPDRVGGGRPELVLHIGFAKTGTSGVQAVLRRGGEALTLQSTEYLDLGIRFNAHHGIAGLLVEHENPRLPDPEADLDQLIDAVRRATARGASRVIISSEGLSTATAIRPAVERLAGSLPLRVVALVRPVLPWIDSLLNQLAKAALFGAADWNQVTDARRILDRDAHFDEQLALWESAVGRDRLTLVVLGPDDDFLAENLRALGVDDSLAALRRPDDANPSLGLDELQFLEWFRTSCPEADHDQRVRISRWLRAYGSGDESFSLVPPSLVTDAREVAAKVQRALSDRYFDGAPVFGEDSHLDQPVTLQPPENERVLRVVRHVLAESDADRVRLVRALETARGVSR